MRSVALAAKYAPMHGGRKMLEQLAEEKQLCSIYDLIVKTPGWTRSIPTADWGRIENGRVAEQRVFQAIREVVQKLSDSR